MSLPFSPTPRHEPRHAHTPPSLDPALPFHVERSLCWTRSAAAAYTFNIVRFWKALFSCPGAGPAVSLHHVQSLGQLQRPSHGLVTPVARGLPAISASPIVCTCAAPAGTMPPRREQATSREVVAASRAKYYTARKVLNFMFGTCAVRATAVVRMEASGPRSTRSSHAL